MQVTRPQAHRGYCRGCRSDTLAQFAGWVTEDARENTVRPRAFYRACTICGMRRMVFGGDLDTPDVEGLCLHVMRARGLYVNGPNDKNANTSSVDPEDALIEMLEVAWLLYLDYVPQGTASYRGWAISILPLRLKRWIDDERGEPSARRVYPKGHAGSVSTSLEGIVATAALEHEANNPGRLDAVILGAVGDFADDRSPDLARVLAARGR